MEAGEWGVLVAKLEILYGVFMEKASIEYNKNVSSHVTMLTYVQYPHLLLLLSNLASQKFK